MKLRSLKELKGNRNNLLIIHIYIYYLDPPRKESPITRARIKNLNPKNAAKYLQNNQKKNHPNRKSLIKPNPKMEANNLKNQTKVKKSNDVTDFFTDLSYPSGLINLDEMHK